MIYVHTYHTYRWWGFCRRGLPAVFPDNCKKKTVEFTAYPFVHHEINGPRLETVSRGQVNEARRPCPVLSDPRTAINDVHMVHSATWRPCMDIEDPLQGLELCGSSGTKHFVQNEAYNGIRQSVEIESYTLNFSMIVIDLKMYCFFLLKLQRSYEKTVLTNVWFKIVIY